MGLEVGLILGAAVSAAGLVAQTVQAKKAGRARKEAQQISGASEEIQNRLARRKAAREERIRRARIINSAEQSGGGGSSGVVGAISALGSNFNAAVAGQKSQELASRGISIQSQKFANAESKSERIDAFVKIGNAGIDLADDLDLF